MKLDVPTLPDSLRSSRVSRSVRVSQSFAFCVVLYRSLLLYFVLFLWVIILSALRFATSDYTFGILKTFLRPVQR